MYVYVPIYLSVYLAYHCKCSWHRERETSSFLDSGAGLSIAVKTRLFRTCPELDHSDVRGTSR